MNEIFKDIPGYEGIYQVSNLGRVKSIKYNNTNTSKVREGKSYGYVRIGLSKKGITTTYFVHRLVAQAFIPNLENKPHINHIDCNPNNNRVENLEWCTRNENMQHASKNGLLANNHFITNNPSKGKLGKDNISSKRVIQYSMSGELIKIWDSIADIQRELKIKQSAISNVLIKRAKSSGGYIWDYAGSQLQTA